MEVYLHTRPTVWYTRDEGLLSQLENPLAFQKQSEDNIKRQIDILKGKEEKVYQSLFKGVSSYEEFIQKVRELFSLESADIAAINNFKSEKIRSILKSKFSTNVVGEKGAQIDLNIIINNPDKIQIRFDRHSKGKKIQLQQKQPLSLQVGIDNNGVKALKQYINNLFGTHFHPESNDLRALRKFIKNELMDGLGEKYTDLMVINPEDTYTALQKTTEILIDSPFSLTKQDLDAAAAEDSKNGEKNKQVQSALKEIKDLFKLSLLAGCSSEMMQAFELTWATSVSKDYSTMALFLKGGNLNYLAGAFGEFQTALVLNYLMIKSKNLADKDFLAKVSETVGKVQGKVDVTFLRDVGIQVKNYNMFAPKEFSRTIPTTTSAADLISRIGEIDATTTMALESFIANYAFTQEYREVGNSPKYEQLVRETFETYYAEMYHLAVNNDVKDSVLFYTVGGTNLIPASAILEMALSNEDARGEVTIKWPTGTTEEILHARREHGYAPFRKYWKRASKELSATSTAGWIRKPAQDPAIKNLMSGVSVRTSFKIADNNLNLNFYRLF